MGGGFRRGGPQGFVAPGAKTAGRTAERTKRAAPRLAAGPLKGPGDDLLSPAKDYHRPRMLNGRVRDGNGWGHPGVVAEKD